MKCVHVPGLLLCMACLFQVSCDSYQPEPEDGHPGDPETARIQGELRLIGLSQDAKSHDLTFGKNDTPEKINEIPDQANQVHERIIYFCPATRNPRLILVGKLRIEACREKKDLHFYDSPATLSTEIRQHPDTFSQ